jgi:starvation-inducible DNA-binding protein
MSATHLAPHPASASGRVAAELQPTLLELIDLGLIAKQAHWNVTGPSFRLLHEEFDEISDAARGWADEVAERLEAIDLAADGRAGTVSAGSGLPVMPEGRLEGATAVRLVTERLGLVAERVRERVRRLEGADTLSQDVLIEIGRGLDEWLWMLRVQIV